MASGGGGALVVPGGREGHRQRYSKELKVRVNMFRIDIKQLPSRVSQYDVKFTLTGRETEDLFSAKRHREIRDKLWAELVRVKGREIFADTAPAWDGNKLLYTASPLDIPGGRYEMEVDLARRDDREEEHGGKSKRIRKTYKVIINFSRVVSTDSLRQHLEGVAGQEAGALDPREVIQALDVALQRAVGGIGSRFQVVGPSFYDCMNVRPSDGGAEIWMGYFQRLRAGQRKLFLTFDVTAGLFIKGQDLLDLLDQLRVDLRDSHAIKKAVGHLTLGVKHRNRGVFRCDAVTRQSANSLEFEMDGQRVSVARYFEDMKNIRLKHPNLPCIQVKNRRGGGEFVEYYPLELVKVMARRVAGKAEQAHVDNIRRTVSERPDKRLRNITTGLRDFQHNKSDITKSFNINVEQQCYQVAARRLSAPSLKFRRANMDRRGGGGPSQSREDEFLIDDHFVKTGAWNFRDRKMFKGCSRIDQWGIFSFCSCHAGDRHFENKMTEFIRNKGVAEEVGPSMFFYQSREFRNDVAAMFEEANRRFTEEWRRREGEGGGGGDRPRNRIIFCIIEDKDSRTYHEVKRQGDSRFGIITQCVKESRARKCHHAVLENIILKVNAKLGGQNVICPTLYEGKEALFGQRTLVIGADLSHPGAGSRTPSVAALVGTVDKYMTRLSASIAVSPMEEEVKEGGERRAVRSDIIRHEDMKRMVLERMWAFYGVSKKFPRAILYYRDGVADSQFEAVIIEEVRAIKEALADLQSHGLRDCKITAVVHQKRHHVRLFPCEGDRENQDRNGNLLHGVVVDQDITHPTGGDFFLLSHPGLQGTSRPSYYRVILNENQYEVTWLQDVTFTLCHMYASCSRAISGVPVCYYADRLAGRVRDYAYEQWSDTASQASGGSSSSTHQGEQTAPPTIHASIINSMFFA